VTEQFSNIDRWLVDNGHLWSDLSTALGELVEQLNKVGMEIERSNIYLPTLHPQVDSNLSVWRRGEGFIETSQTATVLDVNERPYKSGVLKDIELGHRHGINPAYKASPIYHVIEEGNKEVLAKFTSNSTSYDYPIFKDFVDSGATAYFGHELKLDNTKRSFVSFLTNKGGGFTDEEISTLRTICAPLALIVNRFGAQRVTNTLVRTYLGQDPGKMVLSGQIKQGDVKSMDAAIWFSDLRGFTSMSSTLTPEVLIATLNKYFAALGPVFDQTGGEILKFIGDAILAVFPASRFQSSTQACVSALAAATQAKLA
jgi:adenylate cyclase